MDRTAVKNFAIEARVTLLQQVKAQAERFGVTFDRIIEPQEISGGLMVAGVTLDAAESQQYQRLRRRLVDLQKQEKTLKGSVVALIDEVAYTWFNRLAALRFMKVNGYLKRRVLSSSDPKLVDPDLLREAGGIAELEDLPGFNKSVWLEWVALAEKVPNRDEFLYRRLLGLQCVELAMGLPFLFGESYSALFMPMNLLNEDSIVRKLVNDIAEEDWRDAPHPPAPSPTGGKGGQDNILELEPGTEAERWEVPEGLRQKMKEVARGFRKLPTASEGLLWQALRGSKLAGRKFRRQQPIGVFVVDFFCAAERLIVEVDGAVHDSSEQQDLDLQRQQLLESLGLRFVRVASRDVESDLPGVLRVIEGGLETPHPSPLPQGERGQETSLSAPAPLLPLWEKGLGDEGLPLLPQTPQELTVIDPACGSGHILVYAFDLLFEIYKEQGYLERDIPGLILEHNLHGLDIDERAVQLASFAVLMKARAKNARFLRQPVRLKVLMVKSTRGFDVAALELSGVVRLADWLPLLGAFEDADNLGSLITPPGFDADKLQCQIDALKATVFLKPAAVLSEVLEQSKLLNQNYWVVVANPSYMSNASFNSIVKKYIDVNYPRGKGDLFAAFMERCIKQSNSNGLMGMINQHSWMFLSSYEDLRKAIVANFCIESMLHLGYGIFKELNSKVVQSAAFVIRNSKDLQNHSGVFVRLIDFQGDGERSRVKTLEAIKNPDCGYLYYAKADDFAKIPGSSIAYWASNRIIEIFSSSKFLSDSASLAVGLFTCNNNRFIRLWYEIDLSEFEIRVSKIDAEKSLRKWFPYNKGGEFRKWYGNNEYVVEYEKDGNNIRKYRVLSGQSQSLPGNEFYFQEGITWSFISSSNFGVRKTDKGFVFDVGGSSLFTKENDLMQTISLLCSNVASVFIKIINPTLNFQVGNVANIPLVDKSDTAYIVGDLAQEAISTARQDWDNFETSWDFQTHPLLRYNTQALPQAFTHWQEQSETAFQELKRLEEENNRYWIEAYGLQAELTPEVPDDQITIRRADLARDIRSLISYAVGCMMGRYSLDQPGLVYAGGEYPPHPLTPSPTRGEGGQDTSQNPNLRLSSLTEREGAQDPAPLSPCGRGAGGEGKFLPDTDAILPITDQAYFDDDIVSRFIEFIKIAYSPATLTENLDFIASALELKTGETAQQRIRRYFVSEFISDHIKTYKKRPIYWLFTSGKKRAFSALVYLHRYTPDTIGRLRTDYVLELQLKLEKSIEQAQQTTASSTAAKKQAAKQLKTLQEQQTELRDYQAKLQTVADQRIELDLDDGVAYNYTRFEGLVYEGSDLKMGDLKAKAQWKIELLEKASETPHPSPLPQGEREQETTLSTPAPLLPLWEKGLGDEGSP